MTTINKTITKSRNAFKGGDGDLGWKSKLLEGQMYKSFVEVVEIDNGFVKTLTARSSEPPGEK